jgi:hypothetical protein
VSIEIMSSPRIDTVTTTNTTIPDRTITGCTHRVRIIQAIP